MLFYKLHFEGTTEEIKSMIGEMINYDESFQSDELGTDFDFMEDGNPEISNVEEVEQMADTLKSAAPDAKFKIKGTVENHDNFMDFEITYDSKELLSKSSDWYISYFICKDNYMTYDDFCSQTNLGKKVSKEQFEKWINEECEIIVLDSGDGDVCLKAPLSERNKSPCDVYGFCSGGTNGRYSTPFIDMAYNDSHISFEDGRSYYPNDDESYAQFPSWESEDERESGGRVVWIPTEGGTKYHSYENCSRMENPIQVTEEEAIRRGFDQCGKCW